MKDAHDIRLIQAVVMAAIDLRDATTLNAAVNRALHVLDVASGKVRQTEVSRSVMKHDPRMRALYEACQGILTRLTPEDEST